MALDPNIALQVRGIELPNPLNALAQVSQLQNAQDVREMNALKMQEAQAAMQERNALRQLNHTAPDYENQLFKVNPQLGIAYRKEAATTAAQKATADKAAFDLKVAQRKFGEDLKRGLSANPSDANIIAFGEDAVLQGLYTPEQVKATVSQLLALPASERVRVLSQAGASANELRPQVVAPGSTLVQGGTAVFTAPERQDTDLIRNYNAAKAQGFTGSLFDYERKIKEAGRTPAAAPAPSAPIAVVDPVTGKQVLVSREEALKNRMTPAAAMEALPPKEIQKREAAFPQATSSVKSFESKSDSFVKDLEKLRDHPGLSQITGLVAGRVPAVTAEGRAAQALYDKVVAKGGFQALQDMRDASKTGGALGNVSNQEGKQLTASFAAIQRTQDAKDVRAAIDAAIADIGGAKTRMREAYDSTYSYKAGSAPTAPTLAPNIDALLNKYK